MIIKYIQIAISLMYAIRCNGEIAFMSCLHGVETTPMSNGGKLYSARLRILNQTTTNNDACQLERVPVDFYDQFNSLKVGQFWTDYVRSYERGPFVNWLMGDENMGKPLLDKNIWNYRLSERRGDCLMYDASSKTLTIVNCDKKYLKICSFLGNIRYRKEAYKCEKYFYYFHEVISSQLTTLENPGTRQTSINVVDLFFTGNIDTQVHSETEASGFFRENILQTFDTFRGRFTQFRHVRDECTQSKDVLGISGTDENNVRFNFTRKFCHFNLEPRVLSLNIDDSNNQLELTTLYDVPESNIWCFTDAKTFYPTRVKLVRKEESTYSILTEGDGYYWCLTNDTQYKSKETPKLLFVKDESKLHTQWAVMIEFDQINFLNSVEELEKFYMDRFWDSSLGKKLPSATDIGVHLKRIFYTGQVLYHVSIPAGIDEELLKDSIRHEIIFIRNLAGCNKLDLIPTIKDKIVPSGIGTDRAFDCVGNFNMGPKWVVRPEQSCDDKHIQGEVQSVR